MFRPPGFMGSAFLWEVLINNRPIASTAQGTFLMVEVDPGTYGFVSRIPSSRTPIVRVTAEPGHVYFLKQDLGLTQLTLERVSDAEGRQAIPGLKMVEAAEPVSGDGVAVRASPPPSAGGRFPTTPVAVTFAKAPVRADDIAVIIGNADYSRLAKDIPNVVPAYADAEGFKRYAVDALGVREGNILHLKDATGAQMTRIFGSATDFRGQLFDWVKPGRSKVYVYYSGHGAPGGDGRAYLVPSDADASRIQLNGYPIEALYRNLEQLPALSVTVILEACFSGLSQAGAVAARASNIVVVPHVPGSKRLTVISAGAADQIASWEDDSSHGLFTKYFLKGMSGEADRPPHGNGDGTVEWHELRAYLSEWVTYYARRYYGRDQRPEVSAAQ
ncbi:MAG: caspase family protein [Candidatus Rokubacteria bacterium]|nr:caspase family protein [Candidatus Rokubacteria bacterium]